MTRQGGSDATSRWRGVLGVVLALGLSLACVLMVGPPADAADASGSHGGMTTMAMPADVPAAAAGGQGSPDGSDSCAELCAGASSSTCETAAVLLPLPLLALLLRPRRGSRWWAPRYAPARRPGRRDLRGSPPWTAPTPSRLCVQRV